MKYALAALFTALAVTSANAQLNKSRVVTCTGILIEVDMNPSADFPMAVVYDNTDALNTHTCVLDLGRAGHWPLKDACWTGEKCVLSGPYFKKVGNTYYMRQWDRAEAPDHLRRRDHE
jgi:hypothetical protein